jgi:hypothetical protein
VVEWALSLRRRNASGKLSDGRDLILAAPEAHRSADIRMKGNCQCNAHRHATTGFYVVMLGAMTRLRTENDVLR